MLDLLFEGFRRVEVYLCFEEVLNKFQTNLRINLAKCLQASRIILELEIYVIVALNINLAILQHLFRLLFEDDFTVLCNVFVTS